MNTPILSTNRKKVEFDKKLKQIESDELKLKNLEQDLQRLQARMAEESSPIVEEFCQLRFENLTKLKQFLNDDFFKKKEKRQITFLMMELASGLAQIGDARAQVFLDDLNPPEDEEEKQQSHRHFDSHQFKTSPPTPKENEGRLEIKSLFRQLAKVFHPDKEPLEHLKEEKTSLMKKITAAYENQDLYSLLKLEKEHMGLREFTEDKLELYIKHINDRLKELKAFEAWLKKHGPLSNVYRFVYARKTTIQEYNIRHELSKIEQEVITEKELQNLIWDKSGLRVYLSK